MMRNMALLRQTQKETKEMAKINEAPDAYKRAIQFADEARKMGDDALAKIYAGSLNHNDAANVSRLVDGRVGLAVAFCKAGI